MLAQRVEAREQPLALQDVVEARSAELRERRANQRRLGLVPGGGSAVGLLLGAGLPACGRCTHPLGHRECVKEATLASSASTRVASAAVCSAKCRISWSLTTRPASSRA